MILAGNFVTNSRSQEGVTGHKATPSETSADVSRVMRESCVVATVLVCIATMLLQFWVNLQCSAGDNAPPTLFS